MSKSQDAMAHTGGEKKASAMRVLIVEDHSIVRSGIVGLVDSETDMVVVGEATDGADALEAFRRCGPDIVLMDLQMPKVNGVDAIIGVLGEFPRARILVLTMHGGDSLAVRALKAGAAGFVVKTALRQELIDAMREVHAGRRYVPAHVAVEIAKHIGDEPLSARECQVLRLVADGVGNKQIGSHLSMSEDTVKGHLKHIFAKLGANDRAQAVALALRRGLLEF
jgi:DNA-binding NarL/FixJ family response regulator